MGATPRHDLNRGTELGLLRFVLDHMPAMIAYWDADQRCRFANRAYETWFAVDPEAMVGRTLEELLGPIYPLNLPYIEGALRGEEQLFEREIPDPAGGPPRQSQAHYLPDVVDGEVRGFCVLVVDITRRTVAEAALSALARKLELAERLSALGTLAAGVAHEINNPLAVVMINVERARARSKAQEVDSDVEEALTNAMNGAMRVRDIVKSMKLLARGEDSVATVDVVACVESAIAASANLLRYRGRLVCDFREVGRVVADEARLTRVFVNLLANAAHALPEGRVEDNEVRISTRIDENDVVIEVRDNGVGIAPHHVGRIFEPFFTTREVGEGMGLGLSVSHGIVRAYGGELTVESEVGEGSRFFVRLPAAQERDTAPLAGRPGAPAPTRPGNEAPLLPLSSRRRLSVLLVDDDALLVAALAKSLGDGCDVAVLYDGREAVEALVSGERDHDLVICDLMMPGMSGMDVFEQTVRQRPELAGRFVFMTAGAFTAGGEAFVRSTRVPVLTKPFEMDVLRGLVETYAQSLGAPEGPDLSG